MTISTLTLEDEARYYYNLSLYNIYFDEYKSTVVALMRALVKSSEYSTPDMDLHNLKEWNRERNVMGYKRLANSRRHLRERKVS